ncbi:hypothetical protein ACRAWF_11470 [Streptomyces sp. L7]
MTAVAPHRTSPPPAAHPDRHRHPGRDRRHGLPHGHRHGRPEDGSRPDPLRTPAPRTGIGPPTVPETTGGILDSPAGGLHRLTAPGAAVARWP